MPRLLSLLFLLSVALMLPCLHLNEATAQTPEPLAPSTFEFTSGANTGLDAFAVPDSVLSNIARETSPVGPSAWVEIYGGTASTEMRLKTGKGWMFHGRTSSERRQGMDIMRSLAEGGNAGAALTMGMTYERGFLVPQDPSAAFRYYFDAANGGDPLGRLALGRAYSQGIGVKRDYAESFKWLESAYTAGERRSAIDLARAYEYGLGVSRDTARSEQFWKEAATTGSADAYLGYADFILNTSEKPKTATEIRDLINGAASTGDPQATWLAFDVARAAGDSESASKWFAELDTQAEKGNLTAVTRLADIYRTGGVDGTDLRRAYDLYRKAAQEGDVYSKAWVGKLVLENPEIDKEIDTETAGALVKAAAAQGEPIAYLTLAQQTLKGGDANVAFELASAASELSANDAHTEAAQKIVFGVCNEGVDVQCMAVPIFYFTNRKRTTRDGGVAYENRIDPDHTPSFGVSHVYIPTKAEVSAERKGWFRSARDAILAYTGFTEIPERPDQSTTTVINNEITGGAKEFLKTAKQAGAKNGRVKVLVFIHGFNNSFDDAVRRLALFSEQFKYPGIPIVLSWGSAANATLRLSDDSGYSGEGYKNDEVSVSQSCKEFRAILENIVDEFGKDNVMVLGHSMGGRLLHYVLTSCPGLSTDWKAERVFDNVVLAAPDIDKFEFMQDIENARKFANSFTIYASANDRALKISQALVGGRSRVGQGGSDRVLVAGIDTIDASSVEDLPGGDLLNHAYVFEVPQVKRDLAELLKGTRKPDERVCPAKYQDPNSNLPYWLMQPDCAN